MESQYLIGVPYPITSGTVSPGNCVRPCAFCKSDLELEAVNVECAEREGIIIACVFCMMSLAAASGEEIDVRAMVGAEKMSVADALQLIAAMHQKAS